MTVCYEEASAARKAALGCCKTGHIKETTKMAALWLRGSFLLKAREIEDIQSPGHLKESRAERRESRLGMDISGALSLRRERQEEVGRRTRETSIVEEQEGKPHYYRENKRLSGRGELGRPRPGS